MVHNVYFTLHDRSDAAAAKLIVACKKYLTVQPGIEFFAAGSRAKDLVRPVSVQDWDVSLHIVFASPEHQASYQNDPTHHVFIDENKTTWENVRVFDSLVD